MGEITTIGVDLAKSVFQLHGVTADGTVMLGRQLRRSQVLGFFGRLRPCLIGMEACGGAHYWARELMKLGHAVRLMPPSCVKPYVMRGKTDAADAGAVCEAVARPGMRFVSVKSNDQQTVLMMHRTRGFPVRQLEQFRSGWLHPLTRKLRPINGLEHETRLYRVDKCSNAGHERDPDASG